MNTTILDAFKTLAFSRPASRNRGATAPLAVAGTLLLTVGLLTAAKPAAAQQVIGFQPGIGPICTGPLGVAPCAVIQAWMARQQAMSLPMPVPQPSNLAGLPGAGVIPQDGQIVAEIAQDCNGEPRCMAIAWGSVEIQRCRNGIGVEGGCFGPNGEIMRVINRVLPQNLNPNVVIGNVAHDLQHGPGDTNDVTGRNGWLRQRLGF